ARGGPAEELVEALGALGELRDLVIGEEPVEEGGDLFADHLLEVDLRVIALVAPDVVGRDDDVDAVGLAADVRVDPGKLALELVGGEGERAEHAEAAGVGDGGDDVAAVAEGEDGALDPEHLADGCTHETSVSRGRYRIHGLGSTQRAVTPSGRAAS